MQHLLEHIVKGIVNNPDGVSVEVRESVDFPGLTILEITVTDEDKGILIGRKGRTINAIRDIMTIAAIRNDSRIKVLVKDDRAPRDSSQSHSHAPAPTHSNEPQPKVMQEIDTEEDQKYNRIDPTNDSEVEDMLNDDEL